ncbi:hypothetical protein C3Y87_16040 [Carbonactinospora thermoautotrophica]|uniref:Uncharacterized protein n=1 Tax=Carbonactinospora thermoautotrophica TaxID=1469144 RepID=A0A132MUD2_9ACTN|nr:hypothetical protein [Carbonactinospora thermoautotrophica]KWX01453.1 hypothetical protein LI90_2485 [Carbonactinospora thermoautotrophica]MCX9192897.1 hypothetical protein [Carbonactinospora thermoautotrophica]
MTPYRSSLPGEHRFFQVQLTQDPAQHLVRVAELLRGGTSVDAVLAALETSTPREDGSRRTL